MNGPSGAMDGGPGAYSRRVGPGDIIIIPNKVAHGWSGVTDHVEYLSYRPDPDRVLPAGWVLLLLRTTRPKCQRLASAAVVRRLRQRHRTLIVRVGLRPHTPVRSLASFDGITTL
jgi:hypothetical protein